MVLAEKDTQRSHCGVLHEPQPTGSVANVKHTNPTILIREPLKLSPKNPTTNMSQPQSLSKQLSETLQRVGAFTWIYLHDCKPQT